MKLSPEFLLYRNAMQKRAALWRNLALLVLLLSVLYCTLSNYNFRKKVVKDYKNYIARVTIDEQILEDQNKIRKLKAIAGDEKIKAVILYINSPGGTTFGGESMYHAVRGIAAKKPVVTVMGTVAASSGYMISIAADYVVARNSTITGSIGALLISAEVSELAHKLGVNFIVLKSGKFKAEPLPFTKLDDEVKQVTMSSVMDSYEMFVEIVAERRGLAKDEVYKLADGRVFTGRQAFAHKLIDKIGSEEEALEWLQTSKSIDKNLMVLDFNISDKKKRFEQMLLEPLNYAKSWVLRSLSDLIITKTFNLS